MKYSMYLKFGLDVGFKVLRYSKHFDIKGLLLDFFNEKQIDYFTVDFEDITLILLLNKNVQLEFTKEIASLIKGLSIEPVEVTMDNLHLSDLTGDLECANEKAIISNF